MRYSRNSINQPFIVHSFYDLCFHLSITHFLNVFNLPLLFYGFTTLIRILFFLHVQITELLLGVRMEDRSAHNSKPPGAGKHPPTFLLHVTGDILTDQRTVFGQTGKKQRIPGMMNTVQAIVCQAFWWFKRLT